MFEVGYGVRLGRHRESWSQIQILRGSEGGLERRRGKAVRRRGSEGSETPGTQWDEGCLSHRLGWPLGCSWLLTLFHQAPSFRTPRGGSPQHCRGQRLRLRGPEGPYEGQGLFIFPLLLAKTSGTVTAASKEWGTVSGSWALDPSLILGLIAS